MLTKYVVMGYIEYHIPEHSKTLRLFDHCLRMAQKSDYLVNDTKIKYDS